MRIKALERFEDQNMVEKQRRIALNQWSDPKFVTKIMKGLKNRWADPVKRKNYLKGLQSKENKERHRKITTEFWRRRKEQNALILGT